MIPFPLYGVDLSPRIPTATFHPCFISEDCQKILDEFLVDDPIEAGVEEEKEDQQRKTLIHPIPYSEESKWLYERLTEIVANHNYTQYKFNINGIYGPLQLLEYQEGCFYDWHVDLGDGPSAHRKLSVILQLSDEDSYEGGDVVFKASEEKRTLPRQQGLVCSFPSYVLHKVTPVTKGKRYAIVGWALGQEKFK